MVNGRLDTIILLKQKKNEQNMLNEHKINMHKAIVIIFCNARHRRHDGFHRLNEIDGELFFEHLTRPNVLVRFWKTNTHTHTREQYILHK